MELHINNKLTTFIQYYKLSLITYLTDSMHSNFRLLCLNSVAIGIDTYLAQVLGYS